MHANYYLGFRVYRGFGDLILGKGQVIRRLRGGLGGKQGFVQNCYYGMLSGLGFRV